MSNFNIYLTEDVEPILIELLKSLGFNPCTGSMTINQLNNNNVKLVIMSSSVFNLKFAKELRYNKAFELIIINLSDFNILDITDINSLSPIGFIDNVVNPKTLKYKLINIFENINIKNEISEYKMWFKGVLNTSKEAVVIINSDGTIKIINPVAQHLIGVEEEKAIGKNASRVIIFKSEKNKIDLTDESETEVFEGEIYNRIYKKYINFSGNISCVRSEKGEYKGKILTLKDVGEIKDLFSKINYQSSHDNLTGIYNRKSFINFADQLITLSKYDGSTHGLLVISIDKFKVINDTCGHIAGDELLRKIAYIIKEQDTENKLIKGRIGGDEFGVLLKNSTLSETKHFTSLIKRKISTQDFIWGEKVHPIMCSYGVVTINETTEDHFTLFAAVDDACAISKQKGGGRIELYNNENNEYNKRRGEMMWIHKLKDAITYDQFILYFQDIQSIEISDIRKIEILLRIKDFDGKILLPTDFIPSAEHYGIMPEIDKIVIEKSVMFMKELLLKKGNEYKYLFSINISGTSLIDRSLPNFIQNIFQKYKVPPTLFCFEITETAAIKNMETANNFISSLRRIGCTFSLDDFGSGFSNFSYLKEMNVDYLKIDGSFIVDIENSTINKAIVESINNIGHIMKMKTVAEFVSNNNIIEILKKIGVDYIQGYGISKPTPIEKLLL